MAVAAGCLEPQGATGRHSGVQATHTPEHQGLKAHSHPLHGLAAPEPAHGC